MFTQTAIAAAITTMGAHRDPMQYMSEISGIVEHYSASIARGKADIADVMEMAGGIKANFAFLDDDLAELQTYIKEAESEQFELTADEALSVIASMNEFMTSIVGAVKKLDNIRTIISHMNTFYPHQVLVDNVLIEGADKMGIMEKGAKRIITVCEKFIIQPAINTEVMPDDREQQKDYVDEAFNLALSKMASLNHATLKALADR